jgi:hypothetical protein
MGHKEREAINKKRMGRRGNSTGREKRNNREYKEAGHYLLFLPTNIMLMTVRIPFRKRSTPSAYISSRKHCCTVTRYSQFHSDTRCK